LNDAMLRFIKTRSSNKSNRKGVGFQEDVKRYEDLENLITEDVLTVYKKNDTEGFAYLPSNHFAYIKSKSEIVFDCVNINKFITDSNSTIHLTFVKIPDNTVNLYK